MFEAIARRVVSDLIGIRSDSHHAFPTSISDAFSQGQGGVSAASLNELQEFVHELFVFRLPKTFFIQMAVAGGCICFLLLVGGATIISRILQRSFWVFKATRRSEGLYLIPNALNTFLLFEGIFALVWLAFIIVQYFAYWVRSGSMQHHIATLNLIIWWPLWIGAFMAAWGSFYTAPGALDKGMFGRRSSQIHRFIPRPYIINIFCVGTPIILIVSLIPLIVLAQAHMNSAFVAYKAFASDIESAIGASASGTVSQADAMQFIMRASSIWDKQVQTSYYLAIGYSIWPIWAGIFLLFYVPSGGYLTYLVWKQVRRQKATLVSLRQKYIEDDAVAAHRAALAKQQRGKPDSWYSSAAAGSPMTMGQLISLRASAPMGQPLPDPSDSLLFQPLTSSQMAASTVVPDQGRSPPITPTTYRTRYEPNSPRSKSQYMGTPPLSARRMSVAATEKSDEDVFFPALHPAARQRAAAMSSRRLSAVGGTPYSRYKYLRRCLINLTILYVAVCLGAALYLGVSASLGKSLHEAYRRGPQAITDIVYGCCVATAWGAVVCGGFAVFAIMARLIDPANANVSTTGKGSEAGADPNHRSNAMQRLKYNIKAVAGGHHGRQSDSERSSEGVAEAYGVQEKTRTLPAVPVSVGATMDEEMLMSVDRGSISVPASVFARAPINESQVQSFASRFDNGRLPGHGGGSVPRNALGAYESPLLFELRGQDRDVRRAPRGQQALKMNMRVRPGDGFVLEPSDDFGSSMIDSQATSMAAPDDPTTSMFTRPRPAPQPGRVHRAPTATPPPRSSSISPASPQKRSPESTAPSSRRQSAVSRKKPPKIPFDPVVFDDTDSLIDVQDIVTPRPAATLPPSVSPPSTVKSSHVALPRL